MSDTPATTEKAYHPRNRMFEGRQISSRLVHLHHGSGSRMLALKPEEIKPTVATSLFGGAIAGCVAKTTIAPLDRTKIYFQVSSTRGYSFKSAFKFVLLTYREHGFFALFRGNSATMVRVMPYAAIQFAAFEQYRHLLNVDMDGNRTPARRCIVGSMAGATATCATYPLDTAKARLSISTKKEYASLMAVFVKVVREGGILALYRGIWPTVLGVTPYAGASFFTYETLKLKYEERTGHYPTGPWRMLFGAFAGLVGQSSSYPLDIVRRRMQTGRLDPSNGVLRSLILIYKTEGLKRGLYKGLSMNWVKGPIAVAYSLTDVIALFKPLTSPVLSVCQLILPADCSIMHRLTPTCRLGDPWEILMDI
ncbi:unnamed protein product [Cylicocyclus nassatus]|uniref:Uncharacterized protein n=1 Tax=Cylicocyclus nassatus TaxID=53992 RepID=A0AA36GHE3_CYLNA|nr:unnamed protein product [Cylicocyclus nassatus]